VTATIDQDAAAETWAYPPEREGYVEREGVRVHWELFGSGDRTVLLLPSWSIVPARVWKGQVAHLARRGRVVVFDPRGNGRSDRPADPSAYDLEEFVDDALAVLDATDTDRAAVVGLSMGASRQLMLAARAPERVTHLVFIGPTLPILPSQPSRGSFSDVLETYKGWDKYNEHYWRRDFRDFVEFFFDQCLPEPHSTKQHDDLVGWGLQTDPETLIASEGGGGADHEETLALCAQVRCPALVIHGDQDNISPHARGVALAAATGATLVTIEGGGHVVSGRDPVRVNLLISEFVHGSSPPARFVRAPARTQPRALFVSSPIGLGHAQRDLAIARALREQHSELEVDWLAQHPVTAVLEAAGERIHPASAQLAGESAHIEARSSDHRLPVFQALRELDEILLANFMLFHDVVRSEPYDLWIGDEAWELDHFLHENPELKTSPFAFLTDFVGFLPMDDTAGSREAFLTADYNAYDIELVERFPYVRDAALFVGEHADVIPRTFGPDLPLIPDWVERHFEFTGYVLPFDPADFADTEGLRRELGLPIDKPLVVAAVGGSAVGLPLLRLIAAAFGELRRDVPDAELLLVCGPRIDPGAVEPVDGMCVVGYVHDLFRTFACCDLAVVQGGLTTTMELVANRRPFISIPLRGHFEQNHHVAHRLRRYGAPEPTHYDGLTPAALAAQMRERLGAAVDYLPVETGGAARAAELLLAATGL
jgi:pimeloyl-ACP methyl ester carboxylesterase/UDP:flavonoid glycosyltransferase YjiC (YdhE family)